jgi:tripartite-type tricarboxylate transporter receptor subunit TctC
MTRLATVSSTRKSIPMNKSILALTTAGFAVFLAASVSASQYPSRPLTMIVPFPAGGTSDPLARILAEGVQSALGQSVIVENVSGAGGSIGVGRAARAPPDGYTVVLGGLPTHVFNGAAYTLPYDVVKDFEPIAPLVSIPRVIVSKNAVPATNLTNLVAWAKDQTHILTGTAGPASISELGGRLFEHLTETKLQFIPYRGDVLAVQDVAAGRLDLMFDSITSSLPQARAGRLKLYAVMAPHRPLTAPDIPTVDEAGLPGFYMSLWLGLWAPKGTPETVIAQLRRAIVQTLEEPSAQRRIASLGMEIFPSDRLNPQALRELQRAEIEKWWPIIKAAGIKAD